MVTSPDLTKSETQVELQHRILPSVILTMKVMNKEIVNIKWTWKKDDKGNLPEGVR